MTMTRTLPAAFPDADVLRLAIDAVRALSMDAVQAANSGHPGAPMGLAPAGYLLWRHHLRHNPAHPQWADRDRFVLSAGHASMLLYSLLHLSGYDLPLDELKQFRQWGSRTPGHPELHDTPGVETTTGPLGQGVANSVGMAMAERWLAARFNRPGHEVVDHRTWVFCSDGDLMEGISHEAAELAGHHRLGKLTWIFDDNEITIEGTTKLASSTDQLRRFEGYGWHVVQVEDGNDLTEMDRAIRAAIEETERPTLIALRTTIAFGSPNKAGSASSHGSPLGEDEIRLTKEALGYPSLEPFHVPSVAGADWSEALPRGQAAEAEWNERLDRYRHAFPELAGELEAFLSGELPADWSHGIPASPADGKPEATRVSSGAILQALAKAIPNLLGGSADLAPSNNTTIKAEPSFLPDSPNGRNLHFGVREHAMGAILNGMALHGGVRVYAGTFLVFADYMRPAIRLAALMGLPVTYVFTHDSIGLGEDGPTHQPIEQLASLRAIPNLMDLRPADARETAEAWRLALDRTDGPAFLSLTRQAVPQIDWTQCPAPAALERGACILREASTGTPEAVLIASGSEVHLALLAREQLEAEGVATRVVSLMSWHVFCRQDSVYQESVLPRSAGVRVAVEAGSSFGWERWTGSDGGMVGIDHFGASAPAETLFREFGITAEAVVARVRSLLSRAD